MRVNKKQFTVYELDNEETIINRIASDLNTIPKYIYFSDGIPEDLESSSVSVENLLELIKKQKNAKELYKNISAKISQRDLNFIDDVVKPFVIFNKRINEMDNEYKPLMLTALSEEFKDELEITVNTNKIWSEGNIFKEELKFKTETNKKDVKKQLVLFNQYDKIKKGIPYTDFELLKTQFDILLNVKNRSLLSIFNTIVLDEKMPFATTSDFYKIYKEFIPDLDWGISYNEAIIVKILQKENLEYIKKSDYVDGLIGINQKGNVEINLDLNIEPGNVNREQMTERLLSKINIENIEVESMVENNVKGIFYFPKHKLNRYVFSDMVMNNPLFSSLLSIDESLKATKQRNTLYIHFTHPSFGKVNINLSEHLAVKGDPLIRTNKKIKIGDTYIRAKVREAVNSESVEKAMEMLSKLFVIYDKSYNTIVSEYRKFIPNFDKYKEEETQSVFTSLSLKDTAPDIFISGYAKKCAFHPRIISDEEAKNTDKQVMVFPKEGGNSEPRNYVCDYTENMYPGLRENPLENSGKFPYIPCCYKKNQAETSGSVYRHYYYGENLSQKTVGQQEILKTNKFAPKDHFGQLPEEISRMFKAIDPDMNSKYVRRGVLDTRASFLNCILEILNVDDIFEMTDPDEIEIYLNETRNELDTLDNIALCRQEMYNKTDEEISEDITNPSVYFDPKKLINLVEETYKCNIILFSRTDDNDGEMILPYHTQAYYKNRREYPYILILEHRGSDSDTSMYPRCEIICNHRTNKKDENVQSLFDYSSNIGKKIHNVYEKLRKSYALDKYIPEAVLGKGEIVSQTTDSYGKCRIVNIEISDKILTLFTTPIQPLKVPEEIFLNKLSTKTTLSLCAKLGITISGQITDNNIVKEFIGKWGNIDVNIPVKDDILVNGIPEKILGITYPNTFESKLRDFSKNKKIAKFTIEYMFWLYSWFIDGYEPNTQSMIDFADNSFVIDPYFKYKNISKEFTMDSGILKDEKIVVESEEEIKRLLFVLDLAVKRKRSEIIGYKNRKNIDNFYNDVTDFTPISTQIVLQGENSVKNWIHEKKKRNQIVDRVCPENNSPYFFSNKNIENGSIFIAQNTDTFEKALDICQTWNLLGYNPGTNPEKISEERVKKYTLYSYQSSKDIIQYGEKTLYKIVGYKIGDTSVFTTLLR